MPAAKNLPIVEARTLLKNVLPKGILADVLGDGADVLNKECCEIHGKDPIQIRRVPGTPWPFYLIEASQTCGIAKVWILITERKGLLKPGAVVAAASATSNCAKKVQVLVFFPRKRGKKYYVIQGATDCCGKTAVFFYAL